jgi:hypothetical protein
VNKSFLVLFFKKEPLAFWLVRRQASAAFLKKRSKKLLSIKGANG